MRLLSRHYPYRSALAYPFQGTGSLPATEGAHPLDVFVNNPG